MGIRHVKHIINTQSQQGIEGGKVQISLEAMKVEVGLGGPIVCKSFKKHGQLATHSIVKHTWEFLKDARITIRDQVGDLKSCQEGDRFLTQLFL
jgi:hypothetical protein